ncbi:MAG: hypothetical protein QOD42_2818 [Sphingomonadales bacterium]|jgi:hypothetical protein|nr:hypothetical protein [Sphingomonadales bacterium]
MGLGLSDLFLSNQLVGPLINQRFKLHDILYATVALPFNMQPQTQSNWCWAATSTSTSLYYRPASGWTQCKVASAELSLTCCSAPVPGPCNVTWYLDRALARTENFVSITGPISFQAVDAELRAGRLLGARTGWHGGGGHFMVIYGCSTIDGVQYLNIDDPIYGKSNPSFATFSNNYQGAGSWTHTYFTKAGPLVLKIRFYELAQEFLAPIWKVRPLLAAQTGRDSGLRENAAEPGTSFGLAHPIHVLGLKQVVEGAALSERPVAIRVFETRNGEASAFYDLSPDPERAEILQMAAADNDYTGLLERGLALALRWADDGEAEADLKLLRIPALYTEAIVLQCDGRGEDVALVIRSPQPDVPLFEPIPLKDLLRRLKKPAQALLAEDDDLKGS